MQDRFKFRCWDKDRQRMFDCIQINIAEGAHGSNSIKENECSIHLMYQPHLILMQCTGLKDKNGKLIYEGDIIKCTCQHEDKGGLYYKYGVVEYDINDSESGFGLSMDNDKHAMWRGFKMEIVGNIYENPELLRQQ